METTHQIKRTFLFLFLFLVLSSVIVVAQPPGQELGDITIIYPKQDVFKIGVDNKLHIHAYNSLNELMNVTDYDCFIHVYDVQGNHETEAEMSDDSNWIDKEFILNSSIHNDLGYHSYNIFCNSSSENGAISESFLFNRTGEEITGNCLIIVLAIIGVVLGLLYISFNLNNKHFLLKLLLQIFSIYFLYLLPTFALSINSNVAEVFFNLYSGFIKVFWIYIIVYLSYEVLNYFGKLEVIKRKIKNTNKQRK